MNFGDRILQFKIEKTEPIEIEYVDSLENDNRGGWGSTGL
jgi:dUTPase